MTIFHHDGHLTEAGLRAIPGDDLSETQRLEAAEHLSFCDHCLLRYTNLLEENALQQPAAPLRPAVVRRIRRRGFRVQIGRIGMVAAAACMAVLLWGGLPLENPARGAETGVSSTAQPEGPSLGRRINEAAGNLTTSLNHFFLGFNSTGHRSDEDGGEAEPSRREEGAAEDEPARSAPSGGGSGNA